MKRALILAGGGQKVAFQAGVLQVWLDEAKVHFDLADGASGGVLNLVQWCDGRSGTEIADRWRSLQPLRSVDVNWSEIWRGPYAQSLFRLDRFHRNVLDHWAIDWTHVHERVDRPATFNLFNFSTQQLEVVTNREIDAERLIAGISLPRWFPPVRIGEHRYVDAVYALDANLERAIEDGADELWIVWTVSRRGTWRRGSIADYFQSIEAASNSRFRAMLERIDRNNERIAGGQQGEFDRTISYQVLEAEVPIHYLFAFGADRIAEAVNLGVDRARAWWAAREHPLPEPPPPAAVPGRVERPIDVSFREQATGFLGYGATTPATGETRGIGQKERISLDLAIRIPNVPRFVRDPAHRGEIRGTASITSLGDHDILDDSWYNVLVLDPDDLDRLERRIIPYRLHLRSVRDGRERTLRGQKTCDADLEHRRLGQKHGIRALWPQTTTFDVELYDGWDDGEPTGAQPMACGRMYITLLDFLRQLTTYRSNAGSLLSGVATVARFQRMFVSHLWDVYATGLLSSSPF